MVTPGTPELLHSRAAVFWYVVTIVILLAGMGWIWISTPASTESLAGSEGPLIGHKAPALVVRDLYSGDPIVWDGSEGVPLVLNFWASWCTPCQREIPELMEATSRFGQDVRILGLVEPGDLSAAQSMAQRLAINYELAVDKPDQSTSFTYEVYSLPTTFFIDRRGIVRARVIGEMNSAVLTEGISRILN